MSRTAQPSSPVTAFILAGGQARRMGGRDKALLPLGGRPLLAHVIAALEPQVDVFYINSNRPAADYAEFGLPVVADALPGQLGPLAGLLTGLRTIDHGLLLTVPCDVPLLPADLVTRMRTALEQQDGEICSVEENGRLHAAIMLTSPALLPELETYLHEGGRKVQAWLRSRRLALADFSDRPEAFRNINHPHELQELEQQHAD